MTSSMTSLGLGVIPGEQWFFHKNKGAIKNKPIVPKKERTHRVFLKILERLLKERTEIA